MSFTSSRQTRSFIEFLEPRRILSAAYPISIGPAHTQPKLVEASGLLYFAGANTLYRTDGASGSATSVMPIWSDVFSWKDKLYTRSYFPDSNVIRVDPGTNTATPIRYNGLELQSANDYVPSGDQLFFSGRDWSHNSTGTYVVNATSQAATYLGTGRPIGVAGGYVLIADIENSRLLRTDGTVNGTTVVQSNLRIQTSGESVGSRLVFVSESGLYSSDGTTQGTFPIGMGSVMEMRPGDGVIFILEDTGVASKNIWVTTGLQNGNTLLGSTVGAIPFGTTAITAHLGNTLFYIARSPVSLSNEVFRLEPNGSSTQITFFGAVSGGGVVRGITAVNGKLVFNGNQSDPNRRPWISDGTPGNAQLITGTLPDGSLAAEDVPFGFVTHGGSLYFAQNARNGGSKLFRYAMDDAVIDNRALVIYGTDPAEGGTGADVLSVSLDGPTIDVTINGVLSTFALADVDRIVINSVGGDDTLYVDPEIPRQVIYNASAGQESFVYETGAGNDAVALRPARLDDRGNERIIRGVETLSILTGDGVDTVTITGAPAASNVIDLGADDDVLTVGDGQMPGLTNPLSLIGGAGNDRLTFDNSAEPGGMTYTLTGTTFTAADFALTTFGGFEGDITLLGSPGSEIFNVTPGMSNVWVIDAAMPDATPTQPGDILKLIPGGAAGGVRTLSGSGSGQYTFTNRQSIRFSNVEVSEDFAAPSVAAAEFIVDAKSPTVALTFSEAILTKPVQPALLVRNIATNAIVSSYTDFSYNYVTGVGKWVVVLSNALPAGNYRITISTLGMKDAVGNSFAGDYSFDSFILPGDANRDRKIDSADLAVLSTNWQAIGRTFTQGDFNYDGKVDISDLYILASGWQQTLAPPPPPAVPTSAVRAVAKRTAVRVVGLVE